ncbi:hypothetical protein Tco_0126914 [Tanacetum coccineum]
MRTRSSSNLIGNSSSNPTTSNPKRHNRRRSKQPFSLEESPVVTMTDQRIMAELIRAPTEGYAEAIVVPPILAEHFELKHSLINIMTSDQFFELEKDNPHDHIHWFNKITSTIKYKDVPNSAIKLMLFSFLSCRVNQQTSAVTTAMTAILKQFQATLPPASVKAVEEVCVTCGGAHPYYQCLATDGNTFPEYQDNIQGYAAAAAGNYNQGNSGYHPLVVVNQTRPPGFVQQNGQNNQNRFSQPQGYNRGNNFNQIANYQAPIQQNKLRNEMQNLIQTSMSNQTNELKNMMINFFQMNTTSTSGMGSLPSNTVANPKGELKAITTRSGLVLDGPTIPMPPPFINPKKDERVEETLTDPEHG